MCYEDIRKNYKYRLNKVNGWMSGVFLVWSSGLRVGVIITSDIKASIFRSSS